MSITLPTLDYMYGHLTEFASAPPLADATPAFLFRGDRSDYRETLAQSIGIAGNLVFDLKHTRRCYPIRVNKRLRRLESAPGLGRQRGRHRTGPELQP